MRCMHSDMWDEYVYIAVYRYMVYQFKYDSAQGKYAGDVKVSDDGKNLVIDGKTIIVNSWYANT